jgi:hydroxymethylbilane synthase
MKDVPAALPAGVVLIAVPRREDARDVLVSSGGAGLDGLARGATVGTSSLRRRAQLLARRPDVRPVVLRGNVDTRLRKLADGEVDALLLAAAGLRRLGLAPAGATALAPEVFLPAIGQGALAIEARRHPDVHALLRRLDDAASAVRGAERALLAALGGDCRTPLAAYARLGRPPHIRAMVWEIDGSAAIAAELDGATRPRLPPARRLRRFCWSAARARSSRDARAAAAAPLRRPDDSGGPGDPGLLTIRGRRCLEQCDVVLRQPLESALLAYTRPTPR